MSELLRGQGAELGAYATRFPIEQRTMLHVLDAQARERPDATWIVVDGDAAAHVRRRRRPRPTGRPRAARGPRRRLQRRAVHAQPDRVHAVLLRRPGRRRRRRAAQRRLARAAAAAGDRARRRARDHRPRRPARARCRSSTASAPSSCIVVTAPTGALPESVHGARVVEYRAWIAGRSEQRPRELPGQLRGGADPVHVGHDGQLEGRRLPAPLPVPVLGDRSATRRATPATTC